MVSKEASDQWSMINGQWSMISKEASGQWSMVSKEISDH